MAEKPGGIDYDMAMMKIFLNPEEKINDPNQKISGNVEFMMVASFGAVSILWTKRRKSIQN